MDKITNNIINNLPKKEIKENNKSLNDLANSSPSVDKVMSSNIVDIKDTKKLVAEMAKSAPISIAYKESNELSANIFFNLFPIT